MDIEKGDNGDTKAWAAQGDYRQAMARLRGAVEAGWRDAARVIMS